MSVYRDMHIHGLIRHDLTTDATSSTTGAMQIKGGVGIAQKLFVGTNLDVATAIATNVVDSRTAATLTLGAATATKVEIADTGVTTESKGPLTALEGVTVTGSVDVSTVLTVDDVDSKTATTLLIGKATATKVELADTGITTEAQGPLTALEGVTVTGSVDVSTVLTVDDLDSKTATTLLIGKATATKLELADTGVTTEAQGPLTALEGVTVTGSVDVSTVLTVDDIDSKTAGTLLIGKSTATKLELADTGVTTEVQGPLTTLSNATVGGNLTVDGNLNVTGATITTAMESVNVNITDAHLLLNNGNTSTSAVSTGVVVNYKAEAETVQTTTNGFATGPSTVTVVEGSGGLAAGDIIQVSGAATTANNGIYVIDSIAVGGVGNPDVITIKATTAPGSGGAIFAQTAFVADATDITATITHVNVSHMVNVDGKWNTVSGNTAAAVAPANYKEVLLSGDATSNSSITLTSTSNQITLGTGTTTTVSATAPASSSTYTIPDVGTTADFVLTAGAQTVTGAKTLSAITTVSNTTESTVYTDGALIVSGGVGIAKDLRVNGTIYGKLEVTNDFVTSTAASFTLGTTSTESHVFANNTGAATYTLPAIAANGVKFFIAKVSATAAGANNVTIAPAIGDSIDDGVANSSIVLSNLYERVTLMSCNEGGVKTWLIV